MEWTTIYVAGRPGFFNDVIHQLDDSKLRYLPGTPEGDSACLFWIAEGTSLRDFKRAIGSKIVFKYRLRFYASLDEFNHTRAKKGSDQLTSQEKEMIHKMSAWEAGKNAFRKIA